MSSQVTADDVVDHLKVFVNQGSTPVTIVKVDDTTVRSAYVFDGVIDGAEINLTFANAETSVTSITWV